MIATGSHFMGRGCVAQFAVGIEDGRYYPLPSDAEAIAMGVFIAATGLMLAIVALVSVFDARGEANQGDRV
jgi:hypothetical protein